MMTKTLARGSSPYGSDQRHRPRHGPHPDQRGQVDRPELKKRTKRGSPRDAFAQPVEIGYTVAFLASEKSFNIMGTVIDVTGGMLI